MKEFAGWNYDISDEPGENQWKWVWHGARAIETMYAITNLEGKKILDVGCNKSQLAYCLYKLGYEAYAIDSNPDLYEYHNFSNFYDMDATKMSFEPEQFDTVISISAVEHVPEDQKMIDEIWRVLKPNGLLILTTAYGEGYLSSITRLYSNVSVRKLLKNFDIEEIRYFRFTDDEHDEYDGTGYYENAIMIIKARKCAGTKKR